VTAFRNPLVALELAALRETAGIATARAASALGELTGRSVWMSAPRVHWTPGPWEEFPPGAGRDPMVAVSSSISGALAGSMLFLVAAAAGGPFARLLTGACDAADVNHPLVRSCIVEAANILGGTYLTALGRLTGGEFRVSTPTFSCLPEAELWQGLEQSGEWPIAGLCLETELSITGVEGSLPCRFFILGDQGAFAEVLSGLKAWD
jgi:chemotaxis protein CheY-P-specific phosphatase CheC